MSKADPTTHSAQPKKRDSSAQNVFPALRSQEEIARDDHVWPHDHPLKVIGAILRSLVRKVWR